MPDTDSNSITSVHTGSDLARARAFEAELEAEIAKAKGFGTNYTAYEVRLKSVRSDIEKYLAQQPPIEKNDVVLGSKTPADKLAGFMSSLASTPFGFLHAGLSAAQNAAGFLSGLAQAQKNAAQAAREKARRDQGTNSANPSPTPAQPGNQFSTNSAPSNSIPAPALIPPPHPANPGNSVAPGTTNVPSPVPEIPSPGQNTTNIQPASANSSPTATDSFSAAAGQADALQSVGGRMQAALQQNVLITNSLFQQTLQLIESQNQKLGDVDRKISELSNQIKSLKNP